MLSQQARLLALELEPDLVVLRLAGPPDLALHLDGPGG